MKFDVALKQMKMNMLHFVLFMYVVKQLFFYPLTLTINNLLLWRFH
jgi:hypothetical protein